jgi:hypothetical protein
MGGSCATAGGSVGGSCEGGGSALETASHWLPKEWNWPSNLFLADALVLLPLQAVRHVRAGI